MPTYNMGTSNSTGMLPAYTGASMVKIISIESEIQQLSMKIDAIDTKYFQHNNVDNRVKTLVLDELSVHTKQVNQNIKQNMQL